VNASQPATEANVKKIAAVILTLAASTLLHAQGAPKNVDAIPLYKGFVRDQSRDETIPGKGGADVGGSYRVYTCRTADLVDVLNWYCSQWKLPLKAGDGPGEDKNTVMTRDVAGTTSRISMRFSPPPLDPKDQTWEGSSEKLAWLTEQWKQKRRKTLGDYVQDAWLEWTAIEANGDFKAIEMHFSDKSFNYRDMTTSQLLELRIGAQTTMGLKRLTTSTSKGAPTEEDLGVPLYPGATYNARFSVVNDAVKQCYWTTNDPPKTVIAFYEKATGQQSTGDPAKNFYMIQIMPAEKRPYLMMINVTPNTNADMGSGKTLLVIVRQKY
jgi:hypothetical protein